jgi:hypothetical protein
VLFCRVQLFAERFSCPVRYRLCGLNQFATDEVRHYAEAAAMRCVVVHEQFIGKKYSQMKLQMKREALEKINRQANEMQVLGEPALCTAIIQ